MACFLLRCPHYFFVLNEVQSLGSSKLKQGFLSTSFELDWFENVSEILWEAADYSRIGIH